MNPGWNKQYLSIATVFLLLAVVGIISYGMGLETDNELLDARDAVRAFKANGLELSPKVASTDDDLAIDGVLPIEYQVDKSEDSILIYEFDTVNKRKLGELSIEKYDIPSRVYRTARNLILLYQPRLPETLEEYKEILPTLQSSQKSILSMMIQKHLLHYLY
jgi:hypothetical protein